MEDFDTTLWGIPSLENSLQPLAPLFANSTAVMPTGSLDRASQELMIDQVLESTPTLRDYKMPLGRDILTGLVPIAPSVETFQAASGSTANAPPLGFIHQQGEILVDGQGKPMTFKGIAFGNEVWSDGNNPLNNDHTGIDFLRVRRMGMNSVRFYLNYKWFEDDSKPYTYKATGWQWLDQNITWAKQNGISLILNMHVPQGGYQSDGKGDALWKVPANQQRLTALWKTIADRYKNETTIAGYGLVNEPIVTSNKQQWQTLAQNIANGIRQVDKNHLLFIEGIIGTQTPTGTNYNGTADQKMIKINDSNTAYEFHYYDPAQFTYQGLDSDYPNGDGGKYPDYNYIENPSSLSWYTGTFDNPQLPAGQTPWKYFEGVKYKVTDPKIKVGVPALVARNIRGTVSYDDIIIREFDPAGKLANTVSAINTNSLTGWSFWSSNGVGTKGVTTAGHNDRAALTITGTTDDANISNYNNTIITKPGYSYQISGWMKGENIAANATAHLRLDFLTSSEKIQVRDKAFLLSKMQPYIDWGKKNHVPLYIGEFGAGVNTFKNNKGGINWVSDVIDIAMANNISFNYHAYHEDYFGLNPGNGKIVDPTKVNQPLKELFTTKLRNIK
jgi:endoglucanase